MTNNSPLRIGIVGAGFSGAALAALLHKLSSRPIEIVLCDKSGQFGVGPAYSTPFTYHLLNVRARDMSAFEDQPLHFVDWLQASVDRQQYFDSSIPLAEQFAPRCLYRQYLADILAGLDVTCEPVEVVDVMTADDHAVLIFDDQRKVVVDVVVFALGNNPPASFPFSVTDDVRCISNPWDYVAVKQIAKTDSVMIIGTGLSMIDTVLTLYHQQHEGKIYAVSRHGLLPLSHAEAKQSAYHLDQADLPKDLRGLMRKVREWTDAHADWRTVIHALRLHVGDIWQRASLQDRKRFLRHILPYWNIHRHRVHVPIMDLLAMLLAQQQLTILSGRVTEVKQGAAQVALRHTHRQAVLPIHWLINCMGPTVAMRAEQQPLLAVLLARKIAVLDELQLGFAVTPLGALQDGMGGASKLLYAVGAPTKGAWWEIGAVPEIRRQVSNLARHLLARE